MSALLVAMVVILLLSGVISRFLARARGYDGELFLLGGLLAGPLAVWAVLTAHQYSIEDLPEDEPEQPEEYRRMPQVQDVPLRQGTPAVAAPPRAATPVINPQPGGASPAGPIRPTPAQATSIPQAMGVQMPPPGAQPPQNKAPEPRPQEAPPEKVSEAPQEQPPNIPAVNPPDRRTDDSELVEAIEIPTANQEGKSEDPRIKSLVELATSEAPVKNRYTMQLEQAAENEQKIRSKRWGRRNAQTEPQQAAPTQWAIGPTPPGEATHGVCPRCNTESFADWYGLCVRCCEPFPVIVAYIDPAAKNTEDKTGSASTTASSAKTGNLLSKLPIKLGR